MIKLFLIVIIALTLTGCGVGGMARSMQPVVERFEEGERLSSEIRGGDQDD